MSPLTWTEEEHVQYINIQGAIAIKRLNRTNPNVLKKIKQTINNEHGEFAYIMIENAGYPEDVVMDSWLVAKYLALKETHNDRPK